MKLSKSEYLFFSFSALIVCVFSLLFYLDFTSRSARGEERIVGTIAFKKRLAQRKYSDQVVWDDIDQTSPVYNNDSIRTADRSEAVVRLSDGSEITINENSMIQLSFTSDEIDIQFKGGSISTRRGDLAGDTVTRMMIKTEDATVNVDKSDVQLSGSREQGVSLVVTKGDATVNSGGKERFVQQNQKAVVEKGSKDLRVYALPLRPLMPAPDAVFVVTGNTARVSFSWEPLRPEQDGTIEVSDSLQFARIIERRKIGGNSTTFILPAGTYFWRLRAVNRTSGTADTGEGRKLTLQRIDPANLITPEQGQLIHYLKSSPLITFKWSGGEMVQEYRLDIALERSMKKLAGSYRTSDNALAVDNLKEGVYFWRVTSMISIGGNSNSVPSAVRMLKLSRKKTIEPPVPQFPPDEGTVGEKVLKEKGVIFSWRNDLDIKAARLTIARDRNFSSIVFKGRSAANFINVRLDLVPGTYYWKLQGILPGNQATEESPVLKLSVTAGQTIALVYPAEKSELMSQGIQRSVNLSWAKSDMYGEYIVQISKRLDFSRIDKEEQVTDNHASLSGIIPGKYFWRVMLKNSDGNIVMTSKPGSFTILDTLPEPTIISPGNRAMIDMDKVGELDLRWKRLDEANAYRFRLYIVENNKTRMVTERMINKANYDLTDIDFPGVGEYRWSVQAYEMNQDGSKILRKSSISKSSFTIQSQAAPKKIKIITPRVIYVE